MARMPLRTGSLSEPARAISSGYDREARKLLKAGFKREGGELALAGAQERLSMGNIQSSEGRAESAQLAEEAGRLDRADRFQQSMLDRMKRQKEIDTLRNPAVTSNAAASTQTTTDRPSSVSATPDRKPVSRMSDEDKASALKLAAANREESADKRLKSAGGEVGNLKEWQAKFVKENAAGPDKALAGKTIDQRQGEITEARESTADMLKRQAAQLAGVTDGAEMAEQASAAKLRERQAVLRRAMNDAQVSAITTNSVASAFELMQDRSRREALNPESRYVNAESAQAYDPSGLRKPLANAASAAADLLARYGRSGIRYIARNTQPR